MRLFSKCITVIALSCIVSLQNSSWAQQAATTASKNPKPQQYILKARASEIDPKAKPHPEVDFVFEKDGKPQDTEVASVDTRVTAQGRLVIWLMGHEQRLFDRLNKQGLHAIQVSYANKWFNTLCQPKPKSPEARGNVRLEAAIGEDVSDEIDIPKPDSIMERSRQFLIWLSKENPQGNWQQFLTEDKSAVRWEKVTITGSSHGSTTAARFAMHQKVDRVVMLCGPRDQDQDWQSGKSATPANRFFGFSHVLDTGWSGNHYCRSWEMLGLHQFGPIVNVDETKPPYGNSRRLISAADVKKDPKAAHSSVTPNNASPKNANGEYLYEPVWEYLFNHPVDKTGSPTQKDLSCIVPPGK
ncbi:MAG: hypothetical protein U0930_24240 [Pirellulales bacterium]